MLVPVFYTRRYADLPFPLMSASSSSGGFLPHAGDCSDTLRLLQHSSMRQPLVRFVCHFSAVPVLGKGTG